MMEFLSQQVGLTDLSSLLLWLYEQIVGRLTPASVLRQYRENRLVHPCNLDHHALAEVERCLFLAAPDGFSAIDLSPVSPLGINSVLANTNQKNVLSTVRNVEVAADVTTALAIECAERRASLLRANPRDSQIVHLCTSQRSIRLQPFDDIPGFTSHFRVFGAASAGRDVGHERFEERNVFTHLGMYLDLLNASTKLGYDVAGVKVTISDIRVSEAVITAKGADRKVIGLNTRNEDFDLFAHCEIDIPSIYTSLDDVPTEFVSKFGLERPMSYLNQLKKKTLNHFRDCYPDVNLVFDLGRAAGIGYYDSLCFKLSARTADGKIVILADGGLTDWTKRLLGSKKERLFISGFGTEIFCRCFRALADNAETVVA